MNNVLIAEDDRTVASSVSRILARSGFRVKVVEDGREALRTIHRSRPDAVVLDVKLPTLDGWQVLERIRDISDVPVVLLSSQSRTGELVRGLRAGADDVLTLPFAGPELIARIEALLRRTAQPQWTAERYDDGLLRLDPHTRAVWVEHEERRLTGTEFRLLNALVRNPGVTLTPAQLLLQAWDDPSGIGCERVKFAVLRLRRKLGWPDPATSPVESIRGLGYRYRKP